MTRFSNLARRKEDTTCRAFVDTTVLGELSIAGIKTEGPFDWWAIRNSTEVPTAYFGTMCKWTFERYWYYWVATGPGIPPDIAESLWQGWGKEIRADGDGGCRSPVELNEGFATGTYHIDTQEGLTEFAKLLKSIHQPRQKHAI